jgi:type 2 lantibiotic biosynthesis protein LanM
VGDPELARKRLERWRSRPPFSDPNLWSQRLAADGLDEAGFLNLLGESDDSLADRLPAPDWSAELEAAFAEGGEDADPPLPPLPPFARMANPTGVAFLGLVRPLLRSGWERLRRGLAALEPGGAFDPATAAPIFFDLLLARFLQLLPRTLVLELQAARLEGDLPGETAEERFAAFAARLRDPAAALEILRRYPVLARLAVSALDDWLTTSLELLGRLRADWPQIVAAFSPHGDPGPLDAVKGEAGDLHRGGRAVTLLHFVSGLRLVYKPKPLAAESAFQKILAWANGHGFTPPLPLLGVLDRGGYGWVRFIAAAPCTDVEQVRRFYERQGGYLALFYLLDASDLHEENLIAAGEEPYPVDLEALFHPRVDGAAVQRQEEIPGHGLFQSILRVGFLPKWTAGRGGKARLEHSGLGSIAGQETDPLLHLGGEGTDEIRFERRTAPMPGSRNRPTLDGREAELPDYGNELVAGFTRMLRLVLEHRGELLADGGPLDAFRGAEVRVVFRPTRTYGELLTESFHPDVLGNALFRDRLLDSLWVDVTRRPYIAALIAAERADLTRGDIPLFTARPDSTDLWTAQGERIAGFFDVPGLERVRRAIEKLGEADLEQQRFAITGCLTALDLSRRITMRIPYQLRPTSKPADRGDLLAAARSVGDRLEAIAFRGPRDAWWLTLAALAGERWSFASAQADLYQGVPGIVLFLAYLAEVSGEERFSDLARRGVVTLGSLLERGAIAQRIPGAWNGVGGLIYTLCHLGVLWQDGELLDRAVSFLPRLPDLIAQDRSYDLIDGSAGCAAALLVLHRLRPDAGALDLAVQCGEQLAAGALTRPYGARGVAWPPSVAGYRPLAGYSHGTAGIAWSLLRLAGAAGEPRFRELGLAAIEYERSLYDPVQKNWPDFREDGSPVGVLHDLDPFMSAWCHGAAGVGLARLGTLDLLNDETVQSEIAVALETTLARGFGKNHSLCHGDLGNVDLFLRAAQQLNDPSLEEKAYRLAGGILDSRAEGGWRLGMPRGAEPPGLMIGLAGVGYGLLRLAAPERVPDVLLLEGPELR